MIRAKTGKCDGCGFKGDLYKVGSKYYCCVCMEKHKKEEGIPTLPVVEVDLKEKYRQEALDAATILYKYLNNKETEIIADFEENYGQEDNWNEEITTSFNNKIKNIQTAKKQSWFIKEDLKNKKL